MKFTYLIFCGALATLCFGGTLSAQQQAVSPSTQQEGAEVTTQATSSAVPELSPEKRALIEQIRTQNRQKTEGGCAQRHPNVDYRGEVATHNPKVLTREKPRDENLPDSNRKD